MLKPDSGEILIGQTVKIGYYAQEIASKKTECLNGKTEDIAGLAYMDPDRRVIDYAKDIAEYVQTADGTISASVMLERFLFPAEKQYSPIGRLSGGEKGV